MAESVKNRIFAEIKRRGKGHVFSASDFLKKFKRFEVDRSLTDLQNEGCIAVSYTHLDVYKRQD